MGNRGLTHLLREGIPDRFEDLTNLILSSTLEKFIVFDPERAEMARVDEIPVAVDRGDIYA